MRGHSEGAWERAVMVQEVILRAAARRDGYHRRAPGRTGLDRIFRLEGEQMISEDWVVRYQNRFFQ